MEVVVHEYAIHAVRAPKQMNQVVQAKVLDFRTKASKHPDMNIAASSRTLAAMG